MPRRDRAEREHHRSRAQGDGAEEAMIGLNIGSGQRRFAAPWVNCDLVYDRHKPDVACDGAALPFADGTMDYVVLHHVLEHFGCGEANKLVTALGTDDEVRERR